MVKKIAIIMLIPLLIFVYNMSANEKLSIERLEKTLWQSLINNDFLKFDNNTFRLDRFLGTYIVIASGSYKIEANRLILNVEYKENDKIPNNLVYEYQQSNDNLLYTVYLKAVENYEEMQNRFWAKDSNVPEGSKRFINGIEVIRLKEAVYITLENLNARENPNINSKKFYFRGPELLKEYLPKGFKVIIIARTIKKEKISEWENYWYFVKPYEGGIWRFKLEDESEWMDRMKRPDRYYCWVYGQFIEEMKKE